MKTINRKTFLNMASGIPLSLSMLGCKPPQKTNIQWAINIEMWWRNLPFIERIAQVAKHNFSALELWDYENKDIPAIKKEVEKHHLHITQFTGWGFEPGMNNPKNHALLEQKIKQACAVAKTLNVKLLTVVGGDDQPNMTQEQMHDNIIQGLKRVAPIAEDHNITLILEPMNIRVDHQGHCLYGSKPAIHICQEVNSPHVKINWDLYHMQISEGDLTGHLTEGMPYIGYIQLADHPGRHEPSTGEIYYPYVLQHIHTLGYNGYIGVECYPQNNEQQAAQRLHSATHI